MRRRAALLLALAGCAGRPPPETAALPPRAFPVGTDPTRAAIALTAHALADPARLAGRPDEAAEILALYEYVAVEIAHGPLWAGMPPLVPWLLAEGRREARAVLGVPPAAPPQRVINGLLGFAADPVPGALPADAFPRAAASAATLTALPPLPLAARAASAAQQGLWAMQNEEIWL